VRRHGLIGQCPLSTAGWSLGGWVSAEHSSLVETPPGSGPGIARLTKDARTDPGQLRHVFSSESADRSSWLPPAA